MGSCTTAGRCGKYTEYYRRLREDGLLFYRSEEACKALSARRLGLLRQLRALCSFLGRLLCALCYWQMSCTTSVAGNACCGERPPSSGLGTSQVVFASLSRYWNKNHDNLLAWAMRVLLSALSHTLSSCTLSWGKSSSPAGHWN